jgi:hypothetical protein
MDRHNQPTRRSGRFWVILLLLDMAAIVAVAVTTGQNQANPKGTLAAVFGLVALYFAVFFTVKQREISRGEVADLKGAIRGAHIAAGEEKLTDPTQLSEAELYGAMIVKPLDETALEARKKFWAMQRRGTNTGLVLIVLIYLAVLPIYFLHTFVPALLGVVVIGAIALYQSRGLLGQRLGGVYELTDEVMAPLNLKVTERYTVSIEPTLSRPGGGPQAVPRGAFEMKGERHGRHVEIRAPATTGVRSQRTVEITTESSAHFELRAPDGELRAGEGAPATIGALLRGLPRSSRWDGVHGQVGGGVIRIARKSIKSSDPLLDLWLAERLADALTEGSVPG